MKNGRDVAAKVKGNFTYLPKMENGKLAFGTTPAKG